MEIVELPREGLVRRFRVSLAPEPIAAECARRLAELAAGLDGNGAMPAPQRAAMLSRSEAAIHADILSRAVEAAIARILRNNAIRPAARPAISFEPRAGQGAHHIAIRVETLPEVTPPALADISLERPCAEPDEAELEAALDALRRRHGVWHAVRDVGAALGDEITADISAWPSANLLRNPGAQGGGSPGAVPDHWELRPDGGLSATIVARGAGTLDIRFQGSVGADTRACLAFEDRDGVPAAPGQVFTLAVELRHLAGTLPAGIAFALTLEEFAAPAPGRALGAQAASVVPGADKPALVSMAAQAGDDPALTHMRPALHLGLAQGAVDFTLRVAAPCLLSPAAAPAAPHAALRTEGYAWRLGEDGILPGLDALLLGLVAGGVRRVSLAAPLREVGLPPGLAGRELVVECRAQGLRRLAMPALDDAFATLAGQPSILALRESLANEMRLEFAALSARLLRHALLERLCMTEAALPPTLVDNECRLLAQRAPSGDTAALRTLAEQRLRLRLVLRKLGEGFGLTIAAADLEAALAQEAARFPGQEAEAAAFLRGNAAAARRVADQLWTRRVIDHALSLVQVRDRTVGPAALRAAATALDAHDPGLDDALT